MLRISRRLPFSIAALTRRVGRCAGLRKLSFLALLTTLTLGPLFEPIELAAQFGQPTLLPEASPPGQMTRLPETTPRVARAGIGHRLPPAESCPPRGAPTPHCPAPPPAALGTGVNTHQEPYHVDLIPSHHPWVGSDTTLVPFDPTAFHPDPQQPPCYSPSDEIAVYTGKQHVPTQQPWINGFRGLYKPGEIPVSPTWLGATNPIAPKLLVFGDYRVAAAHIEQNNRDRVNIATRLNLDIDFMLTSTERFHAFVSPLDAAGQFTRFEIQNGELEFIEQFNENFDTFFFEGDLGAMWGGATGQDTPFDMPFVLGLFPWLAQNGVWMNDAVLGVAMTMPARNNPRLDWTNYDITWFAILDELDSPAFSGGDEVQAYGGALFLDAYNGYVESGYAYLNNVSEPSLSYHNFSLAYSRRFRALLSSSFRVIINQGQSGPVRTADGELFIWENSLITKRPSHFIPYMNLFAGFGRPQSVARTGGAGGVLNNTGIVFETDGLNNTPTLDATASNTFGGAVGLNLLRHDYRAQLILEGGVVRVHGRPANRTAAGNQYGLGARYQRALNNAWILRFDGIYGLLDEQADFASFRTELRWKF